MKRVFLIVLDSFGIGYAPDAADFGDVGANTLNSAYLSGKLDIPNMTAMGLGNIEGVSCLSKAKSPKASFARLREISRGKDTTTGHWELMGLVSEKAMPTYPNGFPEDLIKEFSELVGRGVLCNLPYSGTDVIRDYGEEHLKTGKLIVYTSADSVFQIAAHEELIPPQELYEICRKARELLRGEHGVGRVIARPFIGKPASFKRTENRRDFSLLPPKDTALDLIKAKGLDVIGVGKIGDIFAMKGLTETYPTHNNTEGMAKAYELADRDFSGLCFINLVDFDMLFGHRQDAEGYAEALTRFDRWLGDFIKKLKEDDLLIITADHGCDPSDESTDHTREYVPFLSYSPKAEGLDLGTKVGFAFVARSVAEHLGVKNPF
ncbi:MAG: phosphopentomutase [Clostridia bacterium]|nr:phosphopentomutase [Clostridia bacterium]